MITLVLAAMIAVALCLFGIAVVLAAEQAEAREADLQALLLAEEFCNELDEETRGWQ